MNDGANSTVAVEVTSRFQRVDTTREPSHRGGWVLAAVILTIVTAAARLLLNPTFYFADDTQTGTAGQWWELGGRILGGELPILDVHAWTAGNILAEGQWGIFNPGIWIAAVLMRVVGDPLMVITIVKIGALAAMTVGTYFLARSFAASEPWAASAGVLVPLGGFTVYMDAPSWTTGLLVSALVPWVWFGLRQYVEMSRNPLLYLVSVTLLITLGYVFGVIVLVVVFGEMLVRASCQRDRIRILRTLAAGAFAGLLTTAIFLPGILTASVTIRDSSRIENTGFLNADFTDLFATATATSTASVASWGTAATTAPLMYALWAIPAFAFLGVRRRVLADTAPLLWVGAAVLLIVMGPDQVGPIRWPVRFMPTVVLVLCVVFAVTATKTRIQTRERGTAHRSLWIGFITLAVMSWFTLVNTPWEWRQVAVSVVLQAAGILALWYFMVGRGTLKSGASSLGASVAAVVGIALVAPQMWFFPSTPLPQLGFGGTARASAAVPGDVPDDAIVVGNIYAGWRDPATYDERLVANQWYFSDSNVSSLYTVLPYRAYVEDLCADLRGSTCEDALTTLTMPDPTTGRDVAALLGVNTLIVMKASFDGSCSALPEGWGVWRDGQTACVLVRERAVPSAGGVAWSGDGTRVTEIGRSQTDLTFEIDAIGQDGRVVLSRLAWPGYVVDGAVQVVGTRGYLLTVDVTGSSVGDRVTVSFRPPGWGLELACLLIAAVFLVAWPIWHRRRAGRHHVAVSEPATP